MERILKLSAQHTAAHNTTVTTALFDADCKLIVVNIGAVGRRIDGGHFRPSSLYHLLERGELDIPSDRTTWNSVESSIY
jgi:hypothetical protein